MQQACENMKECYIQHAKYFGFHTFFNGNVFPLAILILVIFLLSTTSAILTQYLYPVKVLGIERFIEYMVYVSMGLTSISLLAFSVESSRKFANGVVVRVETLGPTLRICWHLGSFLLTMVFHIYVICFMFR